MRWPLVEFLARRPTEAALSDDARSILAEQYLTGEEPELLDNFPELRFFRDVVFLFKCLQAPTSDALPTSGRAWRPRDAALEWACAGKRPADGLKVRAFGKLLECAYVNPQVDAPSDQPADGTILRATTAISGRGPRDDCGEGGRGVLRDDRYRLRHGQDLLRRRPRH